VQFFEIMLTVTIDGKEHQVQPDAVKAPEGWAIVSPDSEPPSGLIRQTAMDAIIKERVHRAKQATLKEAVESDEVQTAVLSKHGITMQDGKPVGLGGANVDEIKRSLHKELKSEFDKEAGRIKKENERYRTATVTAEIRNAASQAGVRKGLVDLVAQSFAGEFTVSDDLTVALKDADGIKLGTDGKPVTAMSYFEQLKKDPTRADLFDFTQQKGGYGGQNPNPSPAGIKRADLKTSTDKSKFIADYGLEAFNNLK
jgi:hypothetical protein